MLNYAQVREESYYAQNYAGIMCQGLLRILVFFHSVALLLYIDTQKASVGMYSGHAYPYNLVCVLFDPAIPTSSFNCFYTCVL